MLTISLKAVIVRRMERRVNMPEYLKFSMASARARVQLTQQEIADRLGVRRETYSRYENGETGISMELGIKFASICNLPVGAIDFSCPKIPLKVSVGNSL